MSKGMTRSPGGRNARRVGCGGWTLAVLVGLLLPLSAGAELKVGDLAPDFMLQGSDGAQYELKKLLAEGQGVVLAWFPKAFTQG